MSFSVKFATEDGAFEKLFAGKQQAIFSAAQAALAECGARIEQEGRASIAAAGLGQNWEDGLRVGVYFGGKHGSGKILVHHEIRYAMTFEQGRTIQGDPLLWLPLPSCPERIGGRHPTPSIYQKFIGPLQYVKGKGHPLLVGQSSQAPKPPPSPGVKRLSGSRREKVSSLRAGAQRGGYNVPIFFGVPSVTISKKFDVLGVVERAYADLAKSFDANLTETNLG